MESRIGRRLLGRLDARIVFVVGKGGVGKTTAASALALHLAEAGGATRVISTDPAHSLADVFGLSPSDGPVHTAVCGVSLAVEEFDAPAYAEAWIEDASGPIRELFELGTYLDEEDVGRFLELALPGLDEVMAALRLGELLESDDETIVVDTAPTGHTVRMLDAGEVLGSWVGALRAMARKAAAVAEHLTRRSVRLAAEAFVDELEAGIRRFEDRVLADACFLVVTRPEQLVSEETGRLERELDGRGLRACARVVVGGDREGRPTGETEDLAVPVRGDLRGCEGLRRWGTPAGDGLRSGLTDGADSAPLVGEGTARPAAGEPPPGIEELLAPSLLLFAGKGGVGKSTCAAAVALLAAERGETALLSTDPAGSLGTLFDVPVPREGVRVAPGLTAHQIDAEAEFRRFVKERRREVERIFRGLGVGRGAELDREVVESLLELAPPGIDEIVALAAMTELTAEAETLVVDAAPTGHFLRLVRMPETALEWVHELMRLLLEYRSVADVGEAGERLLGVARRLRELRARLTDPGRAAAVIVTLDEPVVSAETRRLRDAVAAAGIPVGAWIHNRSVGEPPEEPPHAAVGFAAPKLSDPPRGAAALRAFVARWKPLA